MRVLLCVAVSFLAYLFGQSVSATRTGSGLVLAGAKEGARAGAVLFHETGCEYCHGAQGVGTDKGPSLLSIGRDWQRPLIEKQIVKGGGGMPAFDELKPDDLSDLLDFLQTKRAKVKKRKS